MPYSPPRACPCGGKIKQGVCDRCGPKRRARDARESAYRRGYDRRWAAFRLRFLGEHPLCEDCQAKGKVTPATDVHHLEKLVDAPERKYDDGNLMALCHECHSMRTARGE